MKQLEQSFKSHGFNFAQVKREDDVAIYRKTRPDSLFESFEVIKVRKYPTYEIAGVTIEEHEAFPPDEAWGDEGFTLRTQEQAFNKFLALHAASPVSQMIGVATGATRGRKRSDFELELPEGEFTVKGLSEKYPDKSVPFIHLRLNELKEQGRVKVVRQQRSESGRGKPQNVYEAMPLDELPEVLEGAEISSGSL